MNIIKGFESSLHSPQCLPVTEIVVILKDTDGIAKDAGQMSV